MNNLFLNRYPYTDFHELNLSWIIEMLSQVEKTLNDFVSINALKYADPIQWNITTQYEKNTIVIDPVSGVAYISVQPVPSGVALTNTDYWTVVFDLGQFVIRASKNFSVHYETDTTTTATFASTAGDWLVWGDTLYKALVNITPGDTYVVDGNIQHFTMEELVGHLDDLLTTDKTSIVNAINELFNAIGSGSSAVGDLNDLLTTDKTSIVNAINELVNVIGDLTNLTTTDKTSIVNAINEVFGMASTIGDLNDLHTIDQTSIVNSINEIVDEFKNLDIINVKDLGAVGDGVTDDTLAIQSAFSSGDRIVFFPVGTYLISNTILIQYSNTHVWGYGACILKDIYTHNFIMFRVENQNDDLYHTSIHGLEFDGQKPVGYNTFISGNVEPALAYFGVPGYATEDHKIRDLYIHDNIGRGIALSATTSPFQSTLKNVVIESCRIVNTRHAIVQSIVTQTVVSNCVLDGSFDENYTIDNGCLGTKIVNSYLGERYLGSGCIGIDYARQVDIIGCTIVGYSPYTGVGATPYGIAFNTGVGSTEEVIISNNRIINGNYGINAIYSNSIIPINNATIIGNEFAGNSLADIHIEASSTRLFIIGNVYGSAGVPLSIPDTYISSIWYCDTPLTFDMTTYLQNSATITVPSLTKVIREGNIVKLCGKVTPASNNIVFLQMPVGLRPSIAGYGASKDCDVWFQIDGTINFEASDLYDSDLGTYKPCTFTAEYPVML